MDTVEKLISALKGSLPFALAIAGGTGLMLFGPKVVQDGLRVDKLPSNVSGFVGPVFVVSALLSVFLLWEHAAKAFRNWRASRRNARIREGVIADLTTQERAALIPFVLQNLSTISYDKEQIGVIFGLCKKGVLYFAGYSPRVGFTYNASPWAWKLMTENPLFVGELEELAEQLGLIEGDTDG